MAASSSAGQLQTANMMVHRASEKGREKQREKELKWHEIPPQEQSLYVSAEKQQWDEHVKYEAVRALSLEESARVRREVPSSRILRSRFAYRDKNYSKRKADPNLGPKPKARLCVAGQTDPDLGTKDLMVDAPTASRHSILLACQLALERQWSASIGDISAAFLNGIKAPRQLYFEQPRRGIPSLEKGQLVEILKGVFGLSTSPKLWWLRLSEELLNLELSFGGEKVKTVQLRRRESQDGAASRGPLCFSAEGGVFPSDPRGNPDARGRFASDVRARAAEADPGAPGQQVPHRWLGGQRVRVHWLRIQVHQGPRRDQP